MYLSRLKKECYEGILYSVYYTIYLYLDYLKGARTNPMSPCIFINKKNKNKMREKQEFLYKTSFVTKRISKINNRKCFKF